jgi:flagellar hook-length control protein FliK
MAIAQHATPTSIESGVSAETIDANQARVASRPASASETSDEVYSFATIARADSMPAGLDKRARLTPEHSDVPEIARRHVAASPADGPPSNPADESTNRGGGDRERPAPAVRVTIEQWVAAAVSNRPLATADADAPSVMAGSHAPVAVPQAAVLMHAPHHGMTSAAASALASTLATGQSSSLPAETSSQIVQSMRLQLAHGGGTAQIRLEPQHFGELTVSIRVDHGQVVARLEADTPVVREWLQTNQSWLRSSLAEQNLTLDRFEVGEAGESRGGDRRHGDSAQSNREDRPRQRRPRPDTGELFEVVA